MLICFKSEPEPRLNFQKDMANNTVSQNVNERWRLLQTHWTLEVLFVAFQLICHGSFSPSLPTQYHVHLKNDQTITDTTDGSRETWLLMMPVVFSLGPCLVTFSGSLLEWIQVIFLGYLAMFYFSCRHRFILRHKEKYVVIINYEIPVTVDLQKFSDLAFRILAITYFVCRCKLSSLAFL